MLTFFLKRHQRKRIVKMIPKINYKTLTIFMALFVCITPTTDAQIWKRLKKKAKEKLKKTEDKLINKLDKKTDKVIDSTIDGKKKTPSKKKEDDRSKSYGTASISHSTLYGMFSVNDLSKTKVRKEGQKVSINGSWWSSGADVFDGYILDIKNVEDINNLKNKTFKIPEEASLKLAYNALVKGKYEYKKGTVHAPQILEVKTGTATVTFNKDQNISISFSASVMLRDHNVEKQMEHNTPATINGMINTNSPQYMITKVNNKKGKSTLVTENDKKNLSPTVNIPGSFSFNKNIEIEITDNSGEKYSMNFLIGNYPDIYGMLAAPKEMQGQGEVIMVMTPKSSTMFMNVAGMKMKKTTSLDQLGDQYNMSDKLPSGADFAYVKTGKTKTILGYTCEEYKVDYDYTNSKGSASFWVSKEFPIQNMELPMLGMKLNNPYLSGFVLELNSSHQGKSTILKVVNVSNKSVTINTSEYRKAGF